MGRACHRRRHVQILHAERVREVEQLVALGVCAVTIGLVVFDAAVISAREAAVAAMVPRVRQVQRIVEDPRAHRRVVRARFVNVRVAVLVPRVTTRLHQVAWGPTRCFAEVERYRPGVALRRPREADGLVHGESGCAGTRRELEGEGFQALAAPGGLVGGHWCGYGRGFGRGQRRGEVCRRWRRSRRGDRRGQRRWLLGWCGSWQRCRLRSGPRCWGLRWRWRWQVAWHGCGLRGRHRRRQRRRLR